MRVQEKLSLFFILFLSFSQRLQSNVYFLTRSPLFEFSHCHSLSVFHALLHSAHTHSLSHTNTLTLAHTITLAHTLTLTHTHSCTHAQTSALGRDLSETEWGTRICIGGPNIERKKCFGLRFRFIKIFWGIFWSKLICSIAKLKLDWCSSNLGLVYPRTHSELCRPRDSLNKTK